jgi:hypothetical protein
LILDVTAPLVSQGSPSHEDHRLQDGLDARHAVERRGQGIADPVPDTTVPTHPSPSPLAEEAVQGLCREGNAGRVPLHPVTVPGPAVSARAYLRQLHSEYSNTYTCTLERVSL